MQIKSSRLNQNSIKLNKPATSSKPSTGTAPSNDSFSFGLRDNSIATGAASLTALAATGAGAYYAGTGAAQFMPSGTSGVMGIVTGALLGGVAGGATGLGLGKLSTEVWPSDQAGNAMTQGFSTFGGAIAGAISGGVAGYFGAQALIVAPATVVGGMAGATVSSAALSFALGD